MHIARARTKPNCRVGERRVAAGKASKRYIMLLLYERATCLRHAGRDEGHPADRKKGWPTPYCARRDTGRGTRRGARRLCVSNSVQQRLENIRPCFGTTGKTTRTVGDLNENVDGERRLIARQSVWTTVGNVFGYGVRDDRRCLETRRRRRPDGKRTRRESVANTARSVSRKNGKPAVGKHR